MGPVYPPWQAARAAGILVTMTRRTARVLTGFAMGFLALALVVILGWAVIGKHRLDEQASRVYQATRLALAALRGWTPATLPAALTAPGTPPRATEQDLVPVVAERIARPAAADRASSRSPPVAA